MNSKEYSLIDASLAQNKAHLHRPLGYITESKAKRLGKEWAQRHNARIGVIYVLSGVRGVHQVAEYLPDGRAVRKGMKMNPRSNYEVIVGNIGTVYSGSNRKEAERIYNNWRKNRSSYRASDEPVTMMVNGDIQKESIVGTAKNPRRKHRRNSWRKQPIRHSRAARLGHGRRKARRRSRR